MRRLAFALTVLTGLASPSHARDALTATVAFALTGSDGADVVALDPALCVFVVDPRTVAGRKLGAMYYLNNTELDRLHFEPSSNTFSRWVQVELHGVEEVYGILHRERRTSETAFC